MKTTQHLVQVGEQKILRGACNIEIDILDLGTNKITYHVKNVPIHTFDQHARARLGVRFFDYKVDEKPVYSLYTEIFDKLSNNEEKCKKFFVLMTVLEARRNESDNKDDYNLMSRNCSYKVEQEFGSLKGQMSRRLKLCEEEQIVALHWLLRQKMIDKGVKLAESFLPGCDATGECDYIAVSDYLSNCFGALFDACGRWDYDKSVYRSFNKSCTTRTLLKEQIGIDIPKSRHEIEQQIS